MKPWKKVETMSEKEFRQFVLYQLIAIYVLIFGVFALAYLMR